MTVQYVGSDGTVQSISTVTKVQPVQNGAKLLIVAGTDEIINARDLIDIT